MNQVGDLKTFRVMGTPPSYPQPLYVWKFWDGSVIATGTYSGSVLKRLNIGGNPAESFTVPYRCDICDNLGNVVQVLHDTVQVNNPPTVVPSPTVTPIDQPVPYQTQIVVRAYDMEDAGVSFFWYLGTNPIGGQDSTVSTPAIVEGTYYGTLTGLMRTQFTNTFNTTVLGAGTAVTCKLVDGDQGTTIAHFDLRGYDPFAPQFAVAAAPDSLTASATNLPVQVIAPNQFVDFSAYSYDTVPGHLKFCWYFYGSNGWTQPGLPIITADTGTVVEQGYKSEITFPIQAETTAGQKLAVVSVSNPTTGKSTFTTIPVELVLNAAPEIASVGVYNPSTAQEMTTVTKLTLPLRTLVRFSGTASDENLDVMTFRWDINSPPATAAYTVWGRDGFVDVTDWTTGAKTSIGIVRAYDRYGAVSDSFSIPTVTIV